MDPALGVAKPRPGTTLTTPRPKIDMAPDPTGDCVVAKTSNSWPRCASPPQRQALKFVVHFVGDVHQPLHDEDNSDKGATPVTWSLNAIPSNLHWIWDPGCSNTSTATRKR